MIKRDRRGRAIFPQKYYSVHSAIGSRMNGIAFRSFRHGNTKLHPSSQVNENNDAVAANIWSSISRRLRLLKCIAEVVRIDSITIFDLSKLRRAKIFIPYDVIFLVRLQGKFDIDTSWEWKGWLWRNARRYLSSLWWHNTSVDLFTYRS